MHSARFSRGSSRRSSFSRIRSPPFRATPLMVRPTTPQGRPATPQGSTYQGQSSADTADAVNSNMTPTVNATPTGSDGSLHDAIKNMSGRLKQLEEKNSTLVTAIKELSQMMKKYCNDSFCIKGSSIEAPLKSELAKLFCQSIRRKPSEADIQRVIKSVLGREAKDRHKFEVAFTFAKNKLTEFRTDERRKVVGLGPYVAKQNWNTDELCDYLLHCMQPPDDFDVTIYFKHLTILRKFIREGTDLFSMKFYDGFRKWLDEEYPGLEINWDEILEADSAFDYTNSGNGANQYLADDQSLLDSMSYVEVSTDCPIHDETEADD